MVQEEKTNIDELKTFGELQIGDTVYSLNYKDWGVLTEHIVSNIRRNEYRTEITIKGYLKHRLIGYTDGDKADFKLVRSNGAKIDEVAPTIEGVKQYWVNEIESRIKRIKDEIEKLNDGLNSEYNSLDKIKNIQN